MEAKLLDIINDCKEYLDRESMNEIIHFYNYDEYEMALEGLLIEMINRKKYPKSYQISDVLNLCYYYKINEESVFDNEIWDKVLRWMDEYSDG